MKNILLGTVLSLAFISCYGQNKKKVSNIVIPMDVTTHRPIVEVMINGQGPYRFIFDTGSSTNVIDESLDKIFGFEVVGEDPLRTPGSENKLVSKRVAVPNVKFPGTSISKNVEMNVIALRSMLPVDGILGGYFLEDYLTTLDYANSKLILSIAELNKDDKDVISFIQNPRHLNLNIEVDGNAVEAHLDSGNPGTFTLPYSMNEKLTFKEPLKKGPPIRTPVASFDSWSGQLIGFIKIGNAVFENPNIKLAEGLEYANLGYGVIKKLRTTIDRKNSLIKFEQVESISSESSILQSPSLTGSFEGDRKIFLDESGELMYQRAGSPVALKLEQIDGDLYEMKIPSGVMAPMEIPKVNFVRNKEMNIVSIELVFKDGSKDGPFKKVSN